METKRFEITIKSSVGSTYRVQVDASSPKAAREEFNRQWEEIAADCDVPCVREWAAEVREVRNA